MSLIEEALRRLREPLLNLPATEAPPPTPTRSQEPVSAHPWPVTPPAPYSGSRVPSRMTISPLVLIALAVLALTVGLLAGGAVWLRHSVTSPRPPARPEASNAKASVLTATAAPEPATPADPLDGSLTVPAAEGLTAQHPPEPFILTGVVEGTGEPYAMINGMIVAVGERVGDATLLEIANGKVRLRQANGEEYVLRVTR